LVFVDEHPPIHLRELCPKDFYFAQILRDKDASVICLLDRMLLDGSSLDDFNVSQAKKFLEWVSTDMLQEKVMTVENWLEVAFHLCKQRWDSSIDWLETQPISKILTMISIVGKFADQQEAQMKKASRR
jgi:hypothetical protein